MTDATTTAQDGINRLLNRGIILDRARGRACPFCQVESGYRCVDRWGLPTGFVHPSRHDNDEDRAADPYPLAEIGPGPMFAGINRNGKAAR